MNNDKVWFVTGGSKGLGLLLVRALLAKGHRVAVTSRSRAQLTEVLGAPSDRLLLLEVDLVDEVSVQRAVQQTITQLGGLDVVVNNAGYGQFGTVEEVADSEARRNFDANVFGTLNVLRAAVGHLRAQGSGHVFDVSSIGGYVGGFTGWGVYCATKFAVAGLTEALHADLKPLGVHVTLVYPGYFRTDFLTAGSMAKPARPIAAYAGARASEALHVDEINGSQPGDPAKAAVALIQASELATPPLHLFLGSDAVAMAESKLEEVKRDLETHRTLSISTDYPKT